MSLIQDETVTDESLADEAADVSAPAPAVKKSRSKLTDEQRAEKQAAKEAAAASRAEAKANKPKKEKAAKVDKFVKVLVPAAESGLRAGTGRFMFLEAAAGVEKLSELVGQEFDVGGKVVKLGMNNMQGMFSRGHIALSVDGETWERIQTTVVTE